MHITGYRLHLNLSASQVRRRLKGHGFGVRKVESAGKNQAVIIHSATGDHRRQLHALFRDVLAERPQDERDDSGAGLPIESLRNLGPVSAAWLGEIGVHTQADLAQLGPVVAYRLVKERQPKASLNLLWALAATLQGTDWRELSGTTKERLLRELEAE